MGGTKISATVFVTAVAWTVLSTTFHHSITVAAVKANATTVPSDTASEIEATTTAFEDTNSNETNYSSETNCVASVLFSEESVECISEEELEDAEPWQPPMHIRELFPVYITGFDYEYRPVEYGKWKIRELFEGDAEGRAQDIADFQRYLTEGLDRFSQGASAFRRFTKNQTLSNILESAAPGSVLLIDFDGFDLRQMASVPTIRFLLKFAAQLHRVQYSVAYGFFINVNFLAQTLINLTRPILGSTFERVEVYGTKEAVWKPRLLRKLPPSQIPHIYGGSKDFKPFFTFG